MTNTATASKVKLRSFEQNDLQKVFDLYGIVFGDAYSKQFQNRWKWAIEDNPLPGDSPRWVLEIDDRIVGFLATIPMSYLINGESVTAHSPCDFMVHPDYRFHGLKLMKAFFAECPNCVSCDDIPATIKVMEWLGAKTVAPVITHAKVLRAEALATRKPFSKTPGFLLKALSGGLRLADAFMLRGDSNINIHPVKENGSELQEVVDRNTSTIPAALAKNPEFLRWRYGKGSPQEDSEIVVATDKHGTPVGYAIYFLATTPKSTGYILDIQAIYGNESSDKVTRALLAHVARRFRKLGASSIRLHTVGASFAPSPKTLKRMGFFVKSRNTRVLMAKFDDPGISAAAAEAENWCYSYGDAEVSHSLA